LDWAVGVLWLNLPVARAGRADELRLCTGTRPQAQAGRMDPAGQLSA